MRKGALGEGLDFQGAQGMGDQESYGWACGHCPLRSEDLGETRECLCLVCWLSCLPQPPSTGFFLQINLILVFSNALDLNTYAQYDSLDFSKTVATLHAHLLFVCVSVICLIYLLFSHSMWHRRSQFPDQESKLHPFTLKGREVYWTTREVLASPVLDCKDKDRVYLTLVIQGSSHCCEHRGN